MTTATQTPGEWGIVNYGPNRFEVQATFPDGGGTRVAIVDRIEDAQLFKAAPALLAALEALRADLLRYPNDDARREAIINAADAAIEQAR